MAKKAKNSDNDTDNVEDYEIVPLKRVLELEKDIKGVRSDPLGSTAQGKEMVSSMRDLSKSMKSMVDLFKDAAESMKSEEAESELLANKLDPLMEKLDKVIDQNTKIAKGILTVADMIKEDIEERKKGGMKPALPLGPIPPPRFHGLESPPQGSSPLGPSPSRSPPPMSQDDLLKSAPGAAGPRPPMGAPGPVPLSGPRPIPSLGNMPPPPGSAPLAPPGGFPAPPSGIPPPPAQKPKRKSLFGR